MHAIIGDGSHHPEPVTPSGPSPTEAMVTGLRMKWRTLLDKSAIYTKTRWGLFFAVCIMYAVRVAILQGFYIVTYGLGIWLLNLLIGFLSPLDDMELGDGNTPILPVSSSDEFRPFFRRLPEFQFWYACTKAVLIAYTLTFFAIFNLPVFWPILLIYFILLFALTAKRQIQHMRKYKYVPFNFGKKTYAGKEEVRLK